LKLGAKENIFMHMHSFVLTEFFKGISGMPELEITATVKKLILV
jgi:hypothetical protein